ncbi:O-methyltransferase [Parabacteroides pacaensis]|uniref:SAM-dependent methyltransferase n=1 Tax=Parabacteroides pacaensis TaxID=2086575 RepID=UPI000D10A1E8|nr:SAM-dependent methyltransferase [Parabacteroides pacaensis]
MHWIPKNTVVKGSIKLYRKIRYRKGFGVHSPFVFNLITKVIDERSPYYRFYDIELERSKLLYHQEPITYPDRQNKYKLRTRTIAEIVRKEAISQKHGALLFRLANYFKSKYILQLGPTVGLSTLYLTSYDTGLKCIVLENIPQFARIAGELFGKQSRNPIDLRTGNYQELLPAALKEMPQVDFIFFNTLYEQHNNLILFEEAVKYVNPDTVFVFEGIRANSQMKSFWREACRHPAVTVTVDLYSLGIIFFNPKLHKRDYIVYF